MRMKFMPGETNLNVKHVTPINLSQMKQETIVLKDDAHQNVEYATGNTFPNEQNNATNDKPEDAIAQGAIGQQMIFEESISDPILHHDMGYWDTIPSPNFYLFSPPAANPENNFISLNDGLVNFAYQK